MLTIKKPQVFIALFLMAILALGTVTAAEARDTGGSDRLVKGAAAGAAVGAITQVVRGRRTGTELLKGAAVGASVGAAVGAYSDYKQEKDARIDEERRADYYEARAYDNNRRARRANRHYGNGGRGNHRAAHRRHTRNCRH